MKGRFLVLILVFAVLVGGILWVMRGYHKGPKEGQEAPEFSLPDRHLKNQSLKDYRGKVVLLNFWATWCAPCVAEMGSLERLYQQLKDKNFEILAVSLDEEGWGTIEEFLKKIPVTFPILLDKDLHVADRYGTYRVPETYLINPEGRIADKILGSQEWDSPRMVSKIQRFLAE